MNSDILTELIAKEPIFHRWERLAGKMPTRSDIEQMTTCEFFEIGASGTLYTRNEALALLEHRYSDPTYRDTPWTAGTFHLLELAANTWLLTYTLIQHQPDGDRTTRRNMVWKKTPPDWKIAFHQGTVVPSK